MRTFEYVAIDASGAAITTRGQARSELDLDRELEARGVTLVRASEVGTSSSRANRSLRHTELIALTTQLATVTAAGVPLVDGLASIGQRMERKEARALVHEMVEGLKGGESLSAVMSRYPSAFPPVYRSSVVAGESSGSLDAVLERLARYLEWARNMKATASQAMIYPAILMSAIFGLVLILLYYVLPRIVKLIPGGRHDLPLQTRIVLGASDFLRDYAAFIAIASIGIAVSCATYFRRPHGRRLLHGALLQVPKAGTLLRQIATSRWASTASILQAAGCDVFTVLNTASECCGNAALAAAFGRATDSVRKGSTITEGLTRESGIDPLLVQMVSVGEKSGELDRCLDRLVAYYDAEVPRSVKKFLSVLEPMLLLGAGGIVAFILLAALMPIFQLYEHMS